MMTDIPEISWIGQRGEARAFTLTEARALFPLVRRLTAESHRELEPIRQLLERTVPTHPDLPEIERQYESIVRRWVGKMERLGLVVKGLWLVDFDTGDGYLCWKYPELKIAHYHGYHEGFDGRRPLDQVVEELDPDWAHG